MKNKNITILTAPIRSGKTTAIIEWLSNTSSVNGILTPDIDGLRKLVNLSNREVIDFQLSEESVEEVVKIGRFIFAKAAFDAAQDMLLNLCKPSGKPIIIDEIGKLELNGEGFEPALGRLLAFHQDTNTPIFVVVRDYLVEEVIAKYHLEGASIYPINGKIEIPILNGLVLAGGYSKRMGRDKASLEYHGKPQYSHVYDLLKPFCNEVFISCKTDKGYELPCIYDDKDYLDIGPIAGLLSAFHSAKTAWLVVGIDYPLFGEREIMNLLEARDIEGLATIYYDDETGFYEPFLGIYEAAFYEVLMQEIKEGNYSLQRILQKVGAKRVEAERKDVIKSVDTWKEFKDVII